MLFAVICTEIRYRTILNNELNIDQEKKPRYAPSPNYDFGSSIDEYHDACLACARKLDTEELWPTPKKYKKLTQNEKANLVKSFRKWALINHPDKSGGKIDLFQEISNCNDFFKEDGKC